MTKKDVFLPVVPLQSVKSWQVFSRLETAACVNRLARLYARILEEPVSARRALKLVHAQLAAFALVLLGGSSLWLALLLCAWMALALVQYRN